MWQSKLPTEFGVPTKGPHLFIGAAFQARFETDKCCKTQYPILLRSSEILIGKMQHESPFPVRQNCFASPSPPGHQPILFQEKSSSEKYNAPD
jgi:hypothetical protein